MIDIAWKKHISFLHHQFIDDSGALSFCKIGFICTAGNHERVIRLNSYICCNSGIIMICRKYLSCILAILNRYCISRICQIYSTHDSACIGTVRHNRSGIFTATEHTVFSQNSHNKASCNSSYGQSRSSQFFSVFRCRFCFHNSFICTTCDSGRV